MSQRSQIGPIVLIVIGVTLLMLNLGLVPADQLMALAGKWWPLLLVVVGIQRLLRVRRDGDRGN